MPTPERPIHLACPRCGHDHASLVSRSRTVLTVACNGCQYTWASGVQGLPDAVLKDVQAILLERAISGISAASPPSSASRRS